MPRKKLSSPNKIRSQTGFTLIELLIVVMITMIIAALAIPATMAGIANIQLRTTASSVASLLQKARMNAVQFNRFNITRSAVGGSGTFLYTDLNVDNVYQTNEPMLQLQRGVTLDFSGTNPTFDSSTLLGYAQTPSSSPMAVAFNQRGLPCNPLPAAAPTSCSSAAVSTTAGSNVGYLYFIKRGGSFATKWAAVTVTSAGRARVWIYGGTTWS